MMDDVTAVLENRAEYAVVQGDSARTLATLPAGRVHVAMCSPPYYALRDYGTGRWEGGDDPACDHKRPSQEAKPHTGPKAKDGNACTNWDHRHEAGFRTVCGKCGARRVDEQIGLEESVGDYLARLLAVFDEVKRVLRDDGLCVVNIGDSYSSTGEVGRNDAARKYPGLEATQAPRAAELHAADTGLAPGNLLGVPWRFALAMQARGWVWRSTVVWHKPSPMPSSLNGWRWQRCRVRIRGQKLRTDSPTHTVAGGMSNGRPHHMDPSWLAEWADCPGCDRCSPNDGLVLRKGSWRPTPAWEPVFIFSKSMGYFADGESVRQPLAVPLHAPGNKKWANGDRNDGDRLEEVWSNPAGANLRDVWTIAAESLHNDFISQTVCVGADEASDGMERIASPDCPVHGRRPAASASCDGRGGSGSSRTSHTDGRPGPERPAEPGPTPAPSLEGSGPSPAGGPAATGRSRRTSKTRRGIPTSPGDTSCEGTSSRTGRTSSPPATGPRHPGTEGNSREGGCGDDGCSPSERTPSRSAGTSDVLPLEAPDGDDGRSPETHNEASSSGSASHGSGASAGTDADTPRRSSCTCSFRKIIITETSHFASFPTALVRQVLRFAASERGVCGVCGAPWARVVEQKHGDTEAHELPKRTGGMGNRTSALSLSGNGSKEWAERGAATTTLGFRPTCQHDAPAVGAVVLDPFAGSGRTGIASRQLGLRFVGIDLSESYCLLARRQIAKALRQTKRQKKKDGQPDLFSGIEE